MNPKQRYVSILTWLGVAFLQIIMTQVITFLFYLLVPGLENFPQTRPVLFIIILGITYTIGVMLVGWLVVRFRWLAVRPILLPRLLAALLGAYLPLVVAVLLYPALEPGNPFFFIAILTAILGFHLPGWMVESGSR